jgi:hypothetical protein
MGVVITLFAIFLVIILELIDWGKVVVTKSIKKIEERGLG